MAPLFTGSKFGFFQNIDFKYSPDPYLTNVSLLLHMNGVNGNTSFIDNSTNNFTVTSSSVQAVTTSTSQSKFGGSSGYFSGNDTYLTVPHNSAFEFGSGDFTLEFFVYFTGFGYLGGTSFSLYAKGTYPNYSIYIWGDGFSSGRLFTDIRDNSNTYIFQGNVIGNHTANNIPLNTWHHYALCRSGNNFYNFWNGNLVQSFSSSSAIKTTTTPVYIGAGRPESDGYENHTGYIDEFRITKGVARYTSSFTVPSFQFQGTAYPIITSNKSALPSNQTATITFRFQEAPTGFELGDAIVSGGYLSNLTATSSTVYTATFNPTSIITNDTATITVSANSYFDPFGGSNLSSSLSFVINAPSEPYFSSVSLLLHMNGTNNSTTFTDSSSNNINVVANGASKISITQSKFGGASGYFDGTSNTNLSVSSSAITLGTNDFTIETWVYPTNVGLYPNIWSQRSSGGITFRINTNQTITFFYGNGTSAFTSASTIQLNTWSHLALTRSSNTFKIWLNGNLIATSGTITASMPGSTARIAEDDNGGGERFYGYLDDFRVTNGVARYTSTFTPPTSQFEDA